MLASQCKRNGRDLSMIVFQSGNTSIGGVVSWASRARTASSIGGVKLNVAPFFNRAVMGRTHLAMFGRNLRQ